MSEWQPIETAPMDGSLFLAIDGVDLESIRTCWMVYDAYDGAYLLHDLWDSEPDATHWMPLPEPPK